MSKVKAGDEILINENSYLPRVSNGPGLFTYKPVSAIVTKVEETEDSKLKLTVTPYSCTGEYILWI